MTLMSATAVFPARRVIKQRVFGRLELVRANIQTSPYRHPNGCLLVLKFLNVQFVINTLPAPPALRPVAHSGSDVAGSSLPCAE